MIPLVVQVELIDQHKATTHAFVHSPVRIGRNSLNDVVLNLPYVSQWHSVVRIDEDKSYYIDLGATNPTVVDGKPLAKHEEVAVDENVDVRIGNIRFHFLRAPAPPELIRPYQRDSAFSLPTPGSFRLADSEAVSDGRSNRPPPRVQAQPPLPAMSPAASTPPAAPAMPPLVAHQPQPAAAFSEPPPPSVRPPAGVVSVTAATAIKSRRPSALPSSMPAGPTDLPRLNQAGAALSPGFGPPRVEPGLYPPQARATGADPVFAEHIQAAFERLDVYHKAYQFAWSNFIEQVERETKTMGAAQRTRFEAALHEQYPAANLQQGFQKALKSSPMAAVNAGALPELEDWFKRLTNGLFPPLSSPRHLVLAMERTGAILEVFSQAFVELRKSQAQFGQEMGLQMVEEESVLHRTEDPRAILAYLLDPTTDGNARIEELSRVFAEFAVHHVALLKAMVEGGRNLMQRMSPESIGKDPSLKIDDSEEADGLFARMFPFEARRMWKRYVALYQILSEEDRYTKELFGRAFARAYYTFTGGRISKPSSY